MMNSQFTAVRYGDGHVNNNAYTIHVPITYGNVGGATTPTTPTLTAAFKSFDDVQNEEDALHLVGRMEHQHQAGFVPPKVMLNLAHQQMHTNNNMQTIMNTSINNNNEHTTVNTSNIVVHDGMTGSDEEDSTMFSDDSSSQQWGSNAIESGSTNSQNSNDSGVNGFGDFNNNKKAKKSKRSGRKRGEKLSPADEERRQVRRERNKQAAARCRKRRLDHTNELLKITDGLESEQMKLRNELAELQRLSNELQMSLDKHNCKKPFNPSNGQQQSRPFSQVATKANRPRPNFLPLSNINANNNQVNHAIVTTAESLVPIQTPSNGIFLDGFMESGTGLTPLLSTPQGFVSNPSSCSGQQRNHNGEVASPETGVPPKLVSL